MSDTEIVRFDAIESEMSAASDRAKLFSDACFQEKLNLRLLEMCAGVKVISVDVFDTLLWRDDSSEATRFYEIAALMANIANKNIARKVRQIDAFVARHLGVKVSYRASDRVSGAREGSLTEIHKVASRLMVGDLSLSEEFVCAEIDYEKEKLTRNEFLYDFIKRMKCDGYRIAILSDMYMHQDQIELLLQHVGIIDADYDLILSSADTKVSKASGGIFPIAEKRLDCRPNEFLHLGDSYLGDFRRPLQRGWRAMHLPIPVTSVSRRRADHVRTANKISSEFGVVVDIKLPE